MIWILIIFIILVGIIVIYLSFEKEDKKENKVDYKNTDIFQELNNLDIKNEKILKVKKEIHKYIVGTENLINSIIVAILADGHIILEGVPGLAKTRTILVFSKVLGLDFKRIQFTPDMLPSDIIGGEIYNKNTAKFEIFKGPIFTNLLLADEINRATPKVQSALLEAMQEKQVTIGNKTFELEKPFFVMATQNPLEQEGTFPLPEAQLDRFLFKVNVDYLNKDEEIKVLDNFDYSLDNIKPILSGEEILELQNEIKNVIIPQKVKEYIVDIVNTTRASSEDIEIGASTRASITFKKASQVVAYLQGKEEVSIDDVKKIILLVLRHRVKLSYKALGNKKKIEEIIFDKIIGVKDF